MSKRVRELGVNWSGRIWINGRWNLGWSCAAMSAEEEQAFVGNCIVVTLLWSWMKDIRGHAQTAGIPVRASRERTYAPNSEHRSKGQADATKQRE